MMRSQILRVMPAVPACSYFQSGATTEPAPATATKPTTSTPVSSAVRVTSSAELIKAIHDRYDGKYLKTMSFLQNNTRYTTTGQELKSQWYEHIEIPGKLRIAFLPASQKSGLVQVGDRVASFDNGIRVDFRRSVNPLLLMTADIYAAPLATIRRGGTTSRFRNSSGRASRRKHELSQASKHENRITAGDGGALRCRCNCAGARAAPNDLRGFCSRT